MNVEKEDMSKLNVLQFKRRINLKSIRTKDQRACVAWNDNEISSFSDEKSNMSLIASHHFDDEENRKVILKLIIYFQTMNYKMLSMRHFLIILENVQKKIF